MSRQKIKPGTLRRILPYAVRYRKQLAVLVLASIACGAITAASPLMLKFMIDDGIMPKKFEVVVMLAFGIVLLALMESFVLYIEARCSGKIGEGLVYDLRTEVFEHVQRQPLAFFSRVQTGALVSRLNTDIAGTRQAITSLLTQAVSALLTLAIVISTMIYLSWEITLVALAMVPLFLFPARIIGRKLQRLTRERMNLDGEMGSMMSERFNVSGAELAKLYGRPASEAALFEEKAGRVRDITALNVVHGRMFFIVITVLTSMTTAIVYGFGGNLVIGGALQIGTLVAMVTLLFRMYGPINQLSGLQIQVLTVLVSFDRIFEVLDLKPLVDEKPDAHELVFIGKGVDAEAGGLDVEFDHVSFRYPTAEEVSLASLEPIALREKDRGDSAWILKELSFTAPAGKLTALVGPSGAGKTTITQLVPRLYEATSGTVRVGGHDVRDVTLQSLSDTVGVVSQETHMFHDTIRANLLYARPEAIEEELIDACKAALIWDSISALPNGLDTVVGERGHRLSGGEKQRIALVRLLLKSPPVVVLDEATAHLDSESEASIQRALKDALAGRTSLVIAHRLSTIREADQILVVQAGRICERGTHEELLAQGGQYASLYHTQFTEETTEIDIQRSA
ncbi:ABC transporter ATP-binding protein [Streptomyces sp. BE133]|uniref:ABC transporter ATP-binding protein n=1 Tax=Streptomyces sp. BE133 TaxID=3002523 RepID=UPI002E7927A6|nr:ABC transporter ATP-binding protein [Streptomyces sp. BE133]MEE1805965.1 ABC transporter ATP-binding protein [Streptomyces sp. BE133]